MEIFGQIFEIVSTLLDGAKIRQLDRCMDILVKEGIVKKNSPEYYELQAKMRG